MERFLKIVALFSAVFIIAACGAEKKVETEKKAFVDLYARFIAPQQSVFAEAFMKTGDSLSNSIQADFPEGIHVNGSLMEKNELPAGKTRYRHQMESESIHQMEFKFKDFEGNPRTYTYIVDIIDSFSINEDNVLRKSGVNLLNWSGNPLKEQESIIMVYTLENGKSFVASIEGPTSASAGKIPDHSYDNIVPGKAELYIVKKKNSLQEEGCNVVSGLTETYSNPQEVMVVE